MNHLHVFKIHQASDILKSRSPPPSRGGVSKCGVLVFVGLCRGGTQVTERLAKEFSALCREESRGFRTVGRKEL